MKNVEKIVNEKILGSNPSQDHWETDPETGKKMGALALFDGKYTDKVRVVQMDDFSIEFCGGTHCDNTSQIGVFKIISEQATVPGSEELKP